MKTCATSLETVNRCYGLPIRLLINHIGFFLNRNIRKGVLDNNNNNNNNNNNGLSLEERKEENVLFNDALKT